MIEFRAREDWIANRITLWVTVLDKPNVGASMSFDLSPEMAERLAQDLQAAVKRYRALDKAATEDIKPKTMLQKGCRVRMKMGGMSRGTISEDTSPNSPQLPVIWDDTPAKVSWYDVQDLMVAE